MLFDAIVFYFWGYFFFILPYFFFFFCSAKKKKHCIFFSYVFFLLVIPHRPTPPHSSTSFLFPNKKKQKQNPTIVKTHSRGACTTLYERFPLFFCAFIRMAGIVGGSVGGACINHSSFFFSLFSSPDVRNITPTFPSFSKDFL